MNPRNSALLVNFEYTISQDKQRISTEPEIKQLIYHRTSEITVTPYKQRALETLRRACSVSLMYMFLAVCERQPHDASGACLG